MAKRPHIGDKFDLLIIIIGSIPFGIFLGLIHGRFLAASIYFTGKFFRAKATYMEILRTTAYANVPSVGLFVMIILKFLLFGKEPCTSNNKFGDLD